MIKAICNVSSIRIRTLSAVSVLAFCAVAGYTCPSFAAETKTVTRTVTVNMLSDNPKLEAQVKTICEGKFTLSDKARKACDDKAFPPLTKALTFRNSGVGAEFNALARQAGDVASK
jgi:hypothetical protein